ncbi:MAG: hypothetical protein AABO58_14470 [Acidobacteriota bacterium]
MLIIHICGAVVGLLSGFLAMFFRKGSGLLERRVHRGVHEAEQRQCSGRRPDVLSGGHGVGDRQAQRWEAGPVRSGRASGRVGGRSRRRDLGSPGGEQSEGLERGMPAALYFVFGSIALLFAASDVRMIRRGGVVGAKRIARHLWRMCFALLITTISFYPGQARLFSAALRATNLLFVPHVLLIGSMIFWMVRVRRSNVGNAKRSVAGTATRSDRTETVWRGLAEVP